MSAIAMTSHPQQQQNLVTMANQIGDFFQYQGGGEAAAMDSIASHLNHFWAPSMRRDLVDWFDWHGGDGLAPLVKAAVGVHRERLLNSQAKVPGEQRLEEPKGGGDAG